MMTLLKAFVDVLALLNRQNITLLYLSVDVGIVRSTFTPYCTFALVIEALGLYIDTTTVIFSSELEPYEKHPRTLSSSQFCCVMSRCIDDCRCILNVTGHL